MSTSGGRGRNKGVNSGRSPAPSKAKVSREIGIPLKYNDDDIKTWLNELKQQIEKDVYNEQAFDKKPNGDSESGNLSVIFKEICNNIKSRSEYKRGLLSKVETLYSKLQKACDDLKADASRGTSILEVHGARPRIKESPEDRQLSTALVNAEKLIEKASSKRDTKGINKKVEKQKQEQQAQEAVKKAEQQWKSKFFDVMNWLNNLRKQISDSEYDEKVFFLKTKTLEGSHEEVNKCHNTILDCCRMLKNENHSKMSHKERFVKDDALNELLECQKRLLKEIEELKKDNYVLLNRLSKMDGADSTIADLSDPYRATKLAEQFSELYDNSWIDAFKVLEIPEETECIQYLLNIVVESYSICADISRKQQIALATALQMPTEGLANKTLRHDSSVNLLELQSPFSDLRKASAVFSVDDVKSYIAAKNVNWVKKSKLRQFTMSCIELCWFMHLQSPPVYLDVTFVTGSKFDTNKYKPYTKSGEQIDFIVFPSLLLHKGGPLLCKGVAQGK